MTKTENARLMELIRANLKEYAKLMAKTDLSDNQAERYAQIEMLNAKAGLNTTRKRKPKP